MLIRPDVIERLLLCKSLLSRIRFQPAAQPDRYFLATQILAAHDAAELGLAAIADQCGKIPGGQQHYLLDYCTSLRELKDVPGRNYFRQLNQVRLAFKHHGVFPEQAQWARVGDTTYGHVSLWCHEYLQISLDELDESSLLVNQDVRKHLDRAKKAMQTKDYKAVLERLAEALYTLLTENAALRGLSVGNPRSQDAIKLAGFGVHGNDFLALQEFLPQASKTEQGFQVSWKQSEFGHPGNWRENSARFCLDAFLDLALKIQNAQWIPGALHLATLYEYKVTALRDGVELWREVNEGGSSPIESLAGTRTRREVVRTLSAGESLRGSISAIRSTEGFLGKGPIEQIWVMTTSPSEFLGFVDLKNVKITCVPRDNPLVKQHFPALPEIDWQPD